MRCSVCGHESPPGSSFCLNCGSALAPAVQHRLPRRPPGCPRTVICASCRGENPPGMKFCRLVRYGARRRRQPAAPAYGAPGMGVSPAMLPQLRTGDVPRCRRSGSTAPGQGFGPSGPLATPPPADRSSAPPRCRSSPSDRRGAGQHDHVPALRHVDAGRLRVLPAVRSAHPTDRADRSGPGAAARRGRRRASSPVGSAASIRKARRSRSPTVRSIRPSQPGAARAGRGADQGAERARRRRVGHAPCSSIATAATASASR